MRILISSQTYAPDANGQAVFTTRLAEGLANEKNEVEVLMPSYSWHAEKKTVNRVTLHYLPAFSLSPWYPEVRFILTSLRQVSNVIKQFRPDIVHIQDHYSLSWLVQRAAHKQHIPVIGTNHFLPENILDNLPVPWVPMKFGTWVLWKSWRLVFDQLDLITTPTPTAAQILRDQLVKPAVIPISCGVDISRFQPRPDLDRKAWRRKFGLAPEKPLFIFVGRVDHEKRLDLLLEAMADLPDDACQLVIVGKGLHLKPLQRLAMQLGLGDKVVFTGYLSADDLPMMLNSADVFVMPSEAELQSIATLEAMASGLPVLAADKCALHELVKPGENGYLFKAGERSSLAAAIRNIISRKSQWQAMGKVSQQIAGKHNFNKTTRAYQEAYHQVLVAAPKVRARLRSKISFNFPFD